MLRRQLKALPILLLPLGCWSSPAAAASIGSGDIIRPVRPAKLPPNRLAIDLQGQLDGLRQKLKARSRTTNLNQAVEQSLLNNPILADSYAQIQQRQWSLIAVRRQWYPQLQASPVGENLYGYRGNTTKFVNSNVQGFQPLTQFNNLVEVGLASRLGWTFFDPSRGPSINSASETLRAQQLLFDVSARDLVLEAQLAYFALQEQQMLIGYYEQILNSTTSQVERMEQLYNAGAAAISDVEQIRTQQLQNLSTLIDTYRQLVDAAARLAQSMALPTGVLALPQDDLTLVGRWDLGENETLKQAEQFREEILASLAQASSSAWTATALFNSYWPKFATLASGSFLGTNRAEGNPGSEITQNRQTAQWNGAVGIGFSWLMFDGGINAAQAEVNLYRQKQFKDQAAVIRLRVAREVERTYANYKASELSLASTRQQLQSAELAAKAVRERFAIGFSDMTSVVQTYNQSIIAASSYARSIRELNSAIAGLYRYSARWPNGALPLVNRLQKKLK